MTAPVVPHDPIEALRKALSGRYEIGREIGQGAFATVYLARDTRHDREIAIKVLNSDSASESGELRFIREIRVLARLQHPNILPLHDSGHVESTLYYVMPYVSGETLRSRMDRERPSPLEMTVSVAREVADALAYAHSHGVIHRDIKPENILLSGGHAIVADFGIARAIDVGGIQQLTRTGFGGIGTPAYMSPEQLLADKQLDGRTDIYSLGCVLYEMLTGRPPFVGKQGFVKRFTEAPPEPSRGRKDVPGWLDTVVMKSLERDPAKRFATAETMAQALASSGAQNAAVVKDQPAPIRSNDPPISYRQRIVTPRQVRETNEPSIGVLPFANMSTDPENEYFSDGITEEILNALARLPTLKVAARSSSFALKGRSMDVTEIGRRLNVRAVLEGSVRRMDKRVRISAQLIDATNGYHIWSERYDRELEDVFAIQDEIARTIVDRLKVKLTKQQDDVLGMRHTENLEAYELYLRGRHCWYRWNISGMMQQAMQHFEAALAKDPEYALAYHGLADGYSILGLYAFAPPSMVNDKAMALAGRGVSLAPELAETHTSLAIVHLLNWNWDAAESSLLRALDINPRYALAHTFHAWLLSTVGRQREAEEAARIGRELDPLNPATNGVAALVSYHGEDYDQSIRECERVLERDPKSFLGLLGISLSYAAKGMYANAIEHAERGARFSPEVNFLRGLLGAVYAMAGDADSARRVIAELNERAQRSYVGPVLLSWIYAHLDEPDKAFEYLGKACDEHSGTLGLGIRFPLYGGIRSDPRFAECLTRLGLH